jgi:hypothetical protein
MRRPQNKPFEYGASDVPAQKVERPLSSARPQAATPNVPRSGTREIANVSGQSLVDAGQQTTSSQPVRAPQPSSSRPVTPPVYPGQMR